MIFALPAFSGLKNRTKADLAAFVRLMIANGLDPTAVGAVIQFESAGTWSPSVHGPEGSFGGPVTYPVGLIQFAPHTAELLGTSTAALERMTFQQQLPFVVRYFQTFGKGQLKRPVDYELATWGAGIGTSDDHILAAKGSPEYDHNPAFDRAKKGTITTGDLRAFIEGTIAKALKRGVVRVDTSRSSAGIAVLAAVVLGGLYFLDGTAGGANE